MMDYVVIMIEHILLAQKGRRFYMYVIHFVRPCMTENESAKFMVTVVY